MNDKKHIPVLENEVLALLSPKEGNKYLDLTAGYGGHAQKILERIGAEGQATLVDRDKASIGHLKEMFRADKRVRIIHQDFLSASKELNRIDAKFDIILADLGISSPHIDNPNRGFSVKEDGPLDMRMDQRQTKTAADLINESNLDELTLILRDYGELKRPKQLAQAIINRRPYRTTQELSEVIESNTKWQKKRIHPATQAFQAIRIAVNDELSQLRQSLGVWVELLAPGGKLGVISFHSLEDRLVKQTFSHYGGDRYDATLQTVTDRPVKASAEEVVFNPRARSAKLRVTQRK